MQILDKKVISFKKFLALVRHEYTSSAVIKIARKGPIKYTRDLYPSDIVGYTNDIMKLSYAHSDRGSQGLIKVVEDYCLKELTSIIPQNLYKEKLETEIYKKDCDSYSGLDYVVRIAPRTYFITSLHEWTLYMSNTNQYRSLDRDAYDYTMTFGLYNHDFLNKKLKTFFIDRANPFDYSEDELLGEYA